MIAKNLLNGKGHFLDNMPRDGSDVSRTRRPLIAPQNDLVLAFVIVSVNARAIVRLEGVDT